MNERFLIVNADDLGLSDGINRGILEAHRNGIVTSASLMVRPSAGGAAAAAVELARANPALGVGLHLDLGEWAYRDGGWMTHYSVVDTNERPAVEAEIARQVERFIELIGCRPTHLDSHQHVHRHEPVRSALLRWGRELGVPVRHESLRHCGDFYGQGRRGEPMPEHITPEALVRLLKALPEGATEMGCHPGYCDDPAQVYRAERAVEVATLCDPRVRAAIAQSNIRLVSYAMFAGIVTRC